MARYFAVRVDGKEYDFDDFSLDEVIELQNLAGEALGVANGIAVDQLNFTDARVLQVFAFVSRKRDYPDVTMDEIGKLKYVKVAALGADEEMPPLPPVEGAENQNGLPTPADTGTRPSPASIPGSALSSSGS